MKKTKMVIICGGKPIKAVCPYCHSYHTITESLFQFCVQCAHTFRLED